MAKRKSDYPRDLEDGFKLFCRSTPEVFEVLGSVISRVEGDRTIKFKGTIRPKKAQVMNAMILFFESLSAEEQVEAVKIGMAKLNEILRKPIPSGPKENPAEGAGDEGSKYRPFHVGGREPKEDASGKKPKRRA